MAQGTSQGGSQDNQEWIVYAAVFIVLIFGSKFIYNHWRAPINTVLMAINYPFVWISYHIPGSPAIGMFNKVHWWTREGEYEWRHMTALASAAGWWFRFPVGIWLFWLNRKAWKSVGIESIYTRKFDMHTLLRNNIKEFPCIAPVAARNILDEPLDKGPWRVARSTLQWCEENALLLDSNGKPVKVDWLIDPVTGMANEHSPLFDIGGNDGLTLDRKVTAALLEKQLGDRFESWDALPTHLKGLSAALMAHASGDKKAAQKLMDQMSLSFIEGMAGSRPMVLDIRGADALATQYGQSKEVVRATQLHNRFVSTWMMALLDFQCGGARAKGVVCTSQFIWLRPADRTIFYALNQMGGRRPWIEAAGPWSHFYLEESARLSIDSPDFTQTILDIESELRDIGILPELKPVTKPGRPTRRLAQ